jgi:glycerol-3-phosphate O-acyltransferase/dihydroxyacetone phosphate acyltransferase
MAMLNYGLSLYAVMRRLLGAALAAYFSRIERFHAERVPRTGPVLFTSNHPNSLTDAFVVGFSVPRKVNFVATVQLFRLPALRWLLSQCGVIPINRVKDDARAMRTVQQTFEACYRVLERGEAIGIFPEGITHDDPQLKAVKTGAARMALELEHRHGGKLGLRIAPVGLTFSAKEIYRSEVLVNFGEPIQVSEFLVGYPEKKHECIRRLTAEIERRIAALILHLPQLERARVVEAVKRLYLDRLLVANRVIYEPVPPKAGDLLLTQAIASAVGFIHQNQPERAILFVKRLDQYERWLKRLNLSDEELALLPNQARLAAQSLAWALLSLILLPIAAYGWLHRAVPVALVHWALKRYGRTSGQKTLISTTTILAGVLSFGVCYGVCILIVQSLFGWPVSLWYALSLPAAGLVAHYYWRGLRRFAICLRASAVWLRARSAARHLLRWREDLISQIEAARWEVPAEALAQPQEGPS